MMYVLLALLLLRGASGSSAASETSETSGVDTTPSASSALGALYRQARSDPYYTSRYGGDGLSVSSGTIGTRSDPAEPRDAAYFESRCITCDPNKSGASSVPDRGYKLRPRYDWYDDDLEDRKYPMSYKNRYDDYDRFKSPGYDYYDRVKSPGYDYYDRVKSPGYDYYDRLKSPGYDYYDRFKSPGYDYYDRFKSPGYYSRYDQEPRPYYDKNYGSGYYERGNGYDNLDSRYPYENRGSGYNAMSKRPPYWYDDPKYDRPKRYPIRYYEGGYDKYDPYSRYDPYDKFSARKPIDDGYYDRFGSRGPPSSLGYGNDVRGGSGGAGIGGGYYSSTASGNWGPGYDRGYASAWKYAGNRDNWRDINRDRDPGYYRPKDYFYDSTAAPGGSRGTSYLHDRQESSTPASNGGISQESATNSPKSQDTNKVYKD